MKPKSLLTKKWSRPLWAADGMPTRRYSCASTMDFLSVWPHPSRLQYRLYLLCFWLLIKSNVILITGEIVAWRCWFRSILMGVVRMSVGQSHRGWESQGALWQLWQRAQVCTGRSRQRSGYWCPPYHGFDLLWAGSRLVIRDLANEGVQAD